MPWALLWRDCSATVMRNTGGTLDRLTTAQAAQRTGASRFAIHRAKNAGQLHPIRANDGGFLFDPDELDAWAARRARAVAQPSRNTAAPETAQDGAQAEIAVLRDRLADAEGRAVAAETRVAVAEALAEDRGARLSVVTSALDAERAGRIEDLRLMLRPTSGRWRWPWGRT